MLSFKYWRQDFMASIVVFLVALPLCLGIALASNAPLASGLFAGIIGGLVVGYLSGSPISVSGPAAGLTVIVAAAIADLGSFQAFTLAVFFSGILQIIFGALRGGSIGDYFPSSVIKGMLTAIGLILILKQVPHALGWDEDFMGDEAFMQMDGQNTFSEILMAFKGLHLGALLIALLSLSLMICWEKLAARGKSFFKLVPGALVAVILAVVLNEILLQTSLGIDGKHLVQLPFGGGLADFAGAFSAPDWSRLSDPKIYHVAFTIAMVGSLESLLSVEASEKLDPESRNVPKNRELMAQGAANACSGLIGGLPITAVIVRTTANVTAGAKTKLSGILHGVWLFLCVVSLPFLLNKIPLSALAAILLLVGYKLAKPSLFKEMYRKGVNQFVPFMVTVLAILFTDLLVGIMIGLAVGFVFVIRSNVHKSIVVVEDEAHVLIRFHKDVSFLHKAQLVEIFNGIKPGSYVILDGSRGVYVDYDIEVLIEEFQRSCVGRNISVEIQKSSVALSALFKDMNYGKN